MSLDANDMAVIRREIIAYANVVLSGRTRETQLQSVPGTESVDSVLSSDAVVRSMQVAHPYGMVSRAPKGTLALVARHGAQPASMLVIAHRDAMRPELGEEGEVAVYDKFGNKVWLKNGAIVALTDKMRVGSETPTDKAARASKTNAELSNLFNELGQVIASVSASLIPISTAFNGTASGQPVNAPSTTVPIFNPSPAGTPPVILVPPAAVDSDVLEID